MLLVLILGKLFCSNKRNIRLIGSPHANRKKQVLWATYFYHKCLLSSKISTFKHSIQKNTKKFAQIC